MNPRTIIIKTTCLIIFISLCSSCEKEKPVAPDITTNLPSSITGTTATSGGNIKSDGGVPVIERGICWMEYSSTLVPTIKDSKTTNGKGTGSFTSSMTGLKTGTKYGVRAYATTRLGTVYGEEVSFSTQLGSKYTAKTTQIISAINTAGYTSSSIATYRAANPLKTGGLVINVDHTATGTYTIRLYHPDAPANVFASWTLNPGQWILNYNNQPITIGNDWGIQLVLPSNTSSVKCFVGAVSTYSTN